MNIQEAAKEYADGQYEPTGTDSPATGYPFSG